MIAYCTTAVNIAQNSSDNLSC